jgi:hypothetical protein
MNPDLPRPVGAGESFDRMLVRKLKQDSFDAAVVAWDLVPPWHADGEYCRWKETVDFYRFLGQSTVLPNVWRERARARFSELEHRAQPGIRSGPPLVERGTILPVCMEPMFESLLVQDERCVKKALNVKQTPAGWPTSGWGDPNERQPDQRLLARAILSIKSIRPQPSYVKQIRGDMRTNKDGWDEYILRRLLMHEDCRTKIENHPISIRLKGLLIPAM